MDLTVARIQAAHRALRNYLLAHSAMAAGFAFMLVAIALILLRPVLPIDETRYLSIAWEMKNGGSVLVPHLNGEIYGHKPPLLFWLINLVWSFFGTGAFGARLIGPAFAALSIWLTARLSRKLWPEQSGDGALASWILASSVVFLLFGSLVMFDTMLVAATLLCLLGIIRARRQPGWGNWLGVGAAIALGIMAKGPVIFFHVMPAALLMPFWADRHDRPPLRAWYGGFTAAVLVAIAIIGVWLVPALIVGGADYRYEVLWHQYDGRIHEAFAHRQPAWFFIALLPVIAWPWGWSKRALNTFRPAELRRDEGTRFCATWFVAAFILFSAVGSKQLHYLLPEIPALALLIARALRGDTERQTEVFSKRPVLALAAPVLLLAIVVVANTNLVTPYLEAKGLSIPWASVLGGVFILLSLIMAILFSRQRVATWVLTAPASLLMAHVILSPVLFRAYDASELGLRLAQYEEQGIALVQDAYRGEFTYVGRLHTTVTNLADGDAVHDWAQKHPGGVVLSRHPVEDNSLVSLGEFKLRGRTYTLLQVAGTRQRSEPGTSSGQLEGNRP